MVTVFGSVVAAVFFIQIYAIPLNSECVTCTSGKRFGGCTSTWGGECFSCEVGTYQDLPSHQQTSCKSCGACSPGKYRASCAAKSAGTCFGCPAGTYAPDTAYRTSCYDHPTCDPGYELIDASSTNPGSCRGMRCPAIPYTPYLAVDYPRGVFYDKDTNNPTVVNFGCMIGYVPGAGAALSAICERDGANVAWSKPAPTCTGVDCGPLTIANGKVMYPNTLHPSTASFSCNSGYELSSYSSRFCQADRQWSRSTPTCNRVQCSFPVNRYLLMETDFTSLQ